jgi:SAM-dependent methyltransferase
MRLAPGRRSRPRPRAHRIDGLPIAVSPLVLDSVREWAGLARGFLRGRRYEPPPAIPPHAFAAPPARTLNVEAFFRSPDPGFPDLRPLLSPGTRVVDVGCGVGRNLSELLRQGFSPVGVDRASSVLAEIAAEHAGSLLQADLFALPLRDGSVDAVVIWQVMCQFDADSQRAAMRELARAVKPGGLLVVAGCPCSQPLHAADLPHGIEIIDEVLLPPIDDGTSSRWLLLLRRRPGSSSCATSRGRIL